MEQLTTINDLKQVLAGEYQKAIVNYFGDQKKAMKFLSGVVSAVQRNPKLLECSGTSVINSFMTMAQLELMPSDVSGEAYVIPYKGQAQFQLGYQGLVTLFYRAGAKSITAEIVRKKDKFNYTNGVIKHSPDFFADDRGPAIGAYVIVELQAGGKVSKVMKKDDIVGIGKKFSKSFKTDYTPWKEANDPELWMWKKTVLKQAAKLVPKNETIFKAIAEDNKESNVANRMEKAKEESKSLAMGNFVKDENKKDKTEAKPAEGDQELNYEPTN
ncbi:MAG: recombinase RecT [Patescibacteria group bacterium]|nr:recombinase RecT [Patescibacteria group bacterium]